MLAAGLSSIDALSMYSMGHTLVAGARPDPPRALRIVDGGARSPH
jgi:hypothetical protein